MKVELHPRLLLLSLALASGAAMAQNGNSSGSRPFATAQQPGERELQEAMRRIAVDPTNADALVDAGNASLQLGDAKSALNFFTRASAVRPNDGRILAGLGSASVRTENPFEALRLFDDAVKLGVNERTIAADRALAFDLLGNFGRAQQDYQIARASSTSDDLIVRQAISLSLSGRTSEADQMLIPLLDRQVMSAWRARAFILAARGDVKGSSKVAAGFLDANVLQKMDRYLKLMPELTDAQKAAAIHLGHFPQSYEIGRDSEQIKRTAATIPAAGSDRLVPSGAPLGSKAAPIIKETAAERRKREREQKKLAEATAKLNTRKKDEPVKVASNSKPVPPKLAISTEGAKAKLAQAQSSNVTVVSGNLPPPENARALVSVSAPQAKLPDAVPVEVKVASALPATTTSSTVTSPPTVSTVEPAVVSNAAPQQADFVGPPVGQSNISTQPTQIAAVQVEPSTLTANVPVTMIPTPGFASVPPVNPVQRADTPPVSAASAFDLGAIVASIDIPESEMHRAIAPVDLSKIKPAAPKVAVADIPAKTEKTKTVSKTPANPPRSWVQVATGNASAYAFEFRQLAKKSPELFGGREGWSSEWGNNDRLLVGPFTDVKEARKWETDFRKSGGNGFVWQSDDGTVVSKVSGATAPKLAAPASTKTPAKGTAKAGTKPEPKAATAKAGAAKASSKQGGKSKGK